MATVYEAVHRNGKRVALKVLHAEFRSNERVRARFLREGYIANRVDHPSVPSVFDDGETAAGDAFLVMDLLHGQTLEARKSSPIGTSEALHIAAEVLGVLASAHQVGVVHRDIKPANVFLTTGGAVAVLDFGIASVRELLSAPDAGSLTQPGFSPGTPSFMAPEQARGRGELVDARTDIWAVGALLFKVLTGRQVHQGASSAEVLIAAATTPAVPIAALRPDLPRSVAHVIDRALALNRELRWPDAHAMRAAISELSSDLNQDERQPPPAELTLPEPETASTTSEQLGSAIDVARGGRLRPSLLLVAMALALVGVGAWAMSRPRPSTAEARGQGAGVTREHHLQRELPPPVEPERELPPAISTPSYVRTVPALSHSASARVASVTLPATAGTTTRASKSGAASATKNAAASAGLDLAPDSTAPVMASARSSLPPTPSTGMYSPDNAWLERQK